MTIRDELRAHLSETGESMRALSLRAGLNAKVVSDILTLDGLNPRHRTLVALSEATGRNLLGAAKGGKPVTFGELVEKLEEAEQKLPASRVRWLLRTANWYAGRPVCRHDVIDFFSSRNAASLGLTKGSRATYKSDILAAVDRHAGRNRPRGVADIGGVWSDAYEAAKDADIPEDCRLKAGPFFVYLFDNGIRPEQVTRDTLAQYYAYRLENGVVTEPKCRAHVANVVTLLRHLATNPATARLGFAPVETPFSDRRDKFGVDDAVLADLLEEFDRCVAPWARGDMSRDGMAYDAFLEALDQEEAEPIAEKKARLRASMAAKSRLSAKTTTAARVERREARLREFGFLAADDRWSARTIATRRGCVVSLAKVLAASHDTVVTSIAELVDYEFLKAAAEALSDSNGGSQDSGYVASVLKSMKKIAVGYVAAPADQIDDIKALIRFHETGRKGISPKNKAKLRQFTAARIQGTIDLSGMVLTRVNGDIERRRKAQRLKTGTLPDRVEVMDVELARDVAAIVAHDILLTRAPRSANVIGAQLDWIAFRDLRAVLTIPATEVKGRANGDPDFVVRLGERASRLLRTYTEQVRPLLLHPADKENLFLFPRQEGGEFVPNMPYGGILQRVTRLLHQHVGVKINPHLYRHLIGWIWLRESMDNLPRVQRLLGHKSLRTTVEYYAELDENLVMDGWQHYLDDKTRTAA